MLKKTLLIILFLILNGPVAQAQSPGFPFVGEITSDDVNIRAGQSENFEQLCQLNKGDRVLVVGKSYSWYKIRLPQTAKSYVHQEFVQLLNPNLGEMKAGRVNIRADSGIHSTVLGKLGEKERIIIIDHENEWFRILPIKDSYGWVREDLLKFVSADTSAFDKETKVVKIEEKVTTTTVEKKIEKKEEPQPEPEPAPKIVEKITEPPKTVEPPKPVLAPGFVRVTGYLKQHKDKKYVDIQHKLVDEKNTTYYIEGLQSILDEFENKKVTIEGKINKDLQNQFSNPVLIISEIRLVL